METRLSIGDFAQITRLTITTLRHYHRVGLLEPDDVDAFTNYRYYTPGQVPTALTIRRYRDLQIPVDGVRLLLAAPDEATRDRLLSEHLAQMRAQLGKTRDAISALQALLTQPDREILIRRRVLEPVHALAESTVIDHAELARWWIQAAAHLRARVPAHPETGEPMLSGMFAHELFTAGRGRATVYAPVDGPQPGSLTISGGLFAVAIHHGPHATLDLTYAALGARLATSGEAGSGPVRETYVRSSMDTPDAEQWQTEICWPLAHRPRR